MRHADRRSFVGIELPGDVVEGLSHAQRDLEAMARRLDAEIELVPSRLLHIPVEDLGVCSDEALEAVELAIERLLPRNPPFRVRVRGFGAFPSREAPRVVWAGVDDRGALQRLRDELHATLDRYGFAVERGRYVPHVPLARVGPQFGGLDASFGNTPFGSVRVRRLTVFRRRRAGARGPLYQPEYMRELERFPENAAPPSDEATLRREVAARLDERLARRAQTRGRSRQKRKSRR